MKKLMVVMLVLLPVIAFAQSPFTKHWIQFSDKNNTPYSLDAPSEFLTQRAVDRRERYELDIVESDLPVDPVYIDQLRAINGLDVLYVSKWFNGAVILIEEEDVLDQVRNLSFVNSNGPLARRSNVSPVERRNLNMKLATGLDSDADDEYYGTAAHQIQMLNGDFLHANGFKGEGMLIAIMDAGFTNADNLEVFASHFANNRIVDTYDFVDFDGNVYEHSKHGSYVFSILGGNSPGFYVGAAPEASFLLYRTEDGPTETRIEEFNWIAAAERADSLGADLFNTSLGYSEFDFEEMNYSYEDMDGNTAWITKGADMAASKGILVVSSAGNMGNKPWEYITAPADGDSVLAVGAVDSLEAYAIFSSRGYSSDGDVKPNVVAQGEQTAYASTNEGALKKGNGTSFSGPIICGMAACLWQSNPSYNNMEIIEQIQKSASLYSDPNEELGNGLPDFYNAMVALSQQAGLEELEKVSAFVYPNPFQDEVAIYYFNLDKEEEVTVEVYDAAGRRLENATFNSQQYTPHKLEFESWKYYPEGVYLVKIYSESSSQILRAIKQ